MKLNLSWHIENWNAPCEDVDYSKKTSLKLFLKKERIEDCRIEAILSSKTMFWDALKELNPIENLSYNPISIFIDECKRFRNILFIRTIEGNKNQEVFEVFCEYLIMNIAVNINWDFKNQETAYEPAYEKFLTELSSKNEKYIYNIIGETEISCFFLAHKRSKKLLEDILSECLDYLKLNSRTKNTPLGNIYLTLKQEVVNAILMKVFEVVYSNPTFSLKKLLFEEKVLDNILSENLKYDVSTCKQQHGFYLIPDNMQKVFYSDLSSLNQILEKTINIEPKLKSFLISEDKLNFNVISNDRNDFCYIKYEPLTETGKKSKYPIILHFNIKNESSTNDQFGDVFLMENNEIGKAKIVIRINYIGYVISVTRNDNKLELSSLETKDKNGNPLILYKRAKT